MHEIASMDLNAEIVKSMSKTPAESADRMISNVMGDHYQFVSSPILNPSPDEQVAMQQVRPSRNFNAKVEPLTRRQVIPNRSWRSGSYVVSNENGKFVLNSVSPRTFLGFQLKDKEDMVHMTTGGNGVERMISYIDNSSMPSDVKTDLTNKLAASAGIRLGEVLEEVRNTGTFTSAMYNSNDYVAQVSPTGMVSEGFFGTGYQWGNTISELPDM
jgi:hypothetical protein|tara:strand:- start:3395 stop:4036 length:642 start_codon:yes stop_codon:yes gene_type:complete